MTNELIKTKLNDIADNSWDTYRTIFNNDYRRFKDSLETVYAYIANRTVQRIKKDEIDLKSQWDLFRLQPINISSDSLKDLFSKYRFNGKEFRISYDTLIHILVKEGIVYRNNSYSSNGKNSSKAKFTKSYALNNDFIRMIAASDGFDSDNLYKCFNAYYPNRLLMKMSVKVKELYDEAVKCDYEEKLDFTADFFDSFSTFGWYYGDERLDIEEMHRDLKMFIGHKKGEYRDNRFYDWFTSVSAAFRTHLTVQGKHYREAYDFHSGMFWMMSIYGWKNGMIELEETEKMIDHCFYGNFYSDISEKPKTKEIKAKFMVYLNSHNGIHRQMYVSDDKDFKTISKNIWKSYPQWAKMVKERRTEFKGETGINNFIDGTLIEKELYLRIEKKLDEMGYTNVRRVHDAIYTIDDVDEIEQLARKTVDDYMSEFVKVAE